VFVAVLAACSQHSTRPGARAYHNLTAKYNAYLQAREKFGEAERALFRSRRENYEELLPILLPIDSLAALSVATELDAVLKKASLVAERHQNSRWLDDAYLLIGQVRLQRADYRNAVETFKYLNTNAEDEAVRHQALLELMRAYVEQRNPDAARRVGEVLRQLPLSDADTRQYYLTKAYLHQRQREYVPMVALLEATLPLMKIGEPRARVHYMLGQAYTLLKQPARAQPHFAAVDRNRPSYELSFYAGLNNSLSTGGKDPQAQFSRMLADRKNTDLQDRIYAAMATYEEQRSAYPQAVRYLQSAVRTNPEEPLRLASTYLRLAELHYEHLQQYGAAQAYYDSVLQLQPRELPGFDRLTARKQALDEFVKHYETIRTEDSLQRLAALNPTELDQYLERTIRERQQRQLAEQQRAQEQTDRARQQALLEASGLTDVGQQEAGAQLWYFYNPQAVAQGRQAFQQRWGNRPLEDNWRRSTKEAALPNTTAALPDSVRTGTPTAAPIALAGLSSSRQAMRAAKDELLAQLPLDPQALVASRKRQETAYFELAKVYRTGLNEPARAMKTFEELLTRFPQTEYEAEALYSLYLLHEGQPTQARYRERLTQQYPTSYFVRLIERSGQSPLSASAEGQAQQAYAEAYQLYQSGQFAAAAERVDTARQAFPGSLIEDKFALLRTLLTAKTRDAAQYRQSLANFLRDYPDSPLVAMARELLSAAERVAVP
jgi:outer membrane protein assembly factor BamD (BamD/ComL family)